MMLRAFPGFNQIHWNAKILKEKQPKFKRNKNLIKGAQKDKSAHSICSIFCFVLFHPTPAQTFMFFFSGFCYQFEFLRLF